MRIRGISEQDASTEVRAIYQDIKDTLKVATVPLVFAYFGNFPGYLAVIWGQLKANYISPNFQFNRNTLMQVSDGGMKQITTMPEELQYFLSPLSDREKSEIVDTVNMLSRVNADLYQMFIAIRENVKGVYYTGQKLLTYDHYDEHTAPGENVSPNSSQTNIVGSQEGLVPLFTNTGLLSVIYPDFFRLTGKYFTQNSTTQAYLVLRVFLEKQAVDAVRTWESPISLPYSDMIQLVKSNPLFPEFLYMLIDVFPTEFARLLLLSGYMHHMLMTTENPGLQVEITQ